MGRLTTWGEEHLVVATALCSNTDRGRVREEELLACHSCFKLLVHIYVCKIWWYCQILKTFTPFTRETCKLLRQSGCWVSLSRVLCTGLRTGYSPGDGDTSKYCTFLQKIYFIEILSAVCPVLLYHCNLLKVTSPFLSENFCTFFWVVSSITICLREWDSHSRWNSFVRCFSSTWGSDAFCRF